MPLGSLLSDSFNIAQYVPTHSFIVFTKLVHVTFGMTFVYVPHPQCLLLADSIVCFLWFRVKIFLQID